MCPQAEEEHSRLVAYRTHSVALMRIVPAPFRCEWLDGTSVEFADRDPVQLAGTR
jgi:hypothetical protein